MQEGQERAREPRQDASACMTLQVNGNLCSFLSSTQYQLLWALTVWTHRRAFCLKRERDVSVWEASVAGSCASRGLESGAACMSVKTSEKTGGKERTRLWVVVFQSDGSETTREGRLPHTRYRFDLVAARASSSPVCTHQRRRPLLSEMPPA